MAPVPLALPATEARRPDHRLTFAVVLVAVATFSLLQSLVIPVLPVIQQGLHTSQKTVTWVLTAYLLAASVATPILGRYGDAVGKKKMFVLALSALGVGSILAGLASSIGVMIVARAIQGVGGALLPLAFGIIREEFPRDRVTLAISTTAALLAVGGGAGIVLAGPIVGALDYHWLFWIPAIAVSLATVAAVFVLPESRLRSPGRPSLLAAFLLSSWLVTLVLSVSEGQAWGWTSPAILALAVATVALCALWMSAERRADTPLVDLTMMRRPAVWTTNLVALLFGAGLYAVIGFLPQFLQTPTSTGYGFGASVTASGLFLLPMTVTMFFAGFASGRLSLRFGPKPVLVLGSLVSVVSFALLVFAPTEKLAVYLSTAVLGVGFGLAFSAMSGIVVVAVPPGQVGVATGMNTNIRTIGGSIGAAAMASIVTSGVAAGSFPTLSDYTHGFAFLMGAAVVAAAAGLLIPNRAALAAATAAAEDEGAVERPVLLGSPLLDAE